MVLRRLARAPLYTAFAVVSLALGLAISTSFYAVLRGVLWPTSGLVQPSRLIVVGRDAARSVRDQTSHSRGDVDHFRAAQQTLIDLAAWTPIRTAFVDPTVATVVQSMAVTGNAFGLLGFRMSDGRPIQVADDTPFAPAVVVVGYHFWLTQLGGAPVVGRMVRVNGAPFEIVGVAAPDVRTLGPARFDRPSLWIPLSAVRHLGARPVPVLDPSNFNTRGLGVIGRLKPGVEFQAARAEAIAIAKQLDQSSPRGATARDWWAEPANEAYATGAVPLVWTLLGLVALVPLVACTNLANLTVARSASRARELAICQALGAGRGILLRDHLIESGAVGVASGGLAVLLTAGLLRFAAGQIPVGVGFEVPANLAPDVLFAAVASTVIAIAMMGVWPAVIAMRLDIPAALGIGACAGAVRSRTRRMVIVAQVAASTLFFVAASTCVRGLASGAASESGVDVDRLALAGVGFAISGWDEIRGRVAAERLLSAARAINGVEAAAVMSGLPFGVPGAQMEASGGDASAAEIHNAFVITATPEFVAVLGMSVVAGRPFDGRDTEGAPPVGLISASTAKTLFGDSPAVGRVISLRPYPQVPSAIAGGDFTIVGITTDTDLAAQGQRRGLIAYVPFAQRYAGSGQIVVRTADPTNASIALREVVRKTEPDLALGPVGTGTYLLAGATLGLAIIAALGAALGGVVLLLAMAGVVGIVAHLVASRTREFGVRRALGATRADVTLLVLSEGLRTAAGGLIVGIILSLLVRLLLAAVLPAALRLDWLSIILVPIPVVVATVLACYLPARRAADVQPTIALRN